MPLVPGTIDSLARTAAVLRALLDGVPDAAATTPDAEGWSARDVVAHLLIINDLGLDRRLRLIVEQDEPFLSDVNEHESLAASGYRERPLAGLLADFAARRASTVEWMRGLGPAQLERGGNHEFAGRVSVCDVSHHLAMHDLMHIAQIANLIAAPRRRPRQHGRRRIRADSAEPLDSATLADAPTRRGRGHASAYRHSCSDSRARARRGPPTRAATANSGSGPAGNDLARDGQVARL